MLIFGSAQILRQLPKSIPKSKSFVDLSKEKITKDCDLRFPHISDGQAVLLQGI